MKHRRIIVVLACCLMLAGVGLMRPVWASSNANNSGCNTIIKGLWKGVNATLGTHYGCKESTKPASRPSEVSNGAHSIKGEYVALGDSVAAGLGLPLAAGANPVCGVSNQAYPARVAQALNLPYRNIACSGATVGDLVTERHASAGEDIAPQLDSAFINGKPRLITITAGANDMEWQYFTDKCYIGSCGSTADQTAISGLRAVMAAKLTYALQSIQKRSSGAAPQVVLTGYYTPFSATCAQQQSAINANEATWLNGQLTDLNQTIKNTASHYSFAQYVPVDFSGHELCTPKPWVQGQNDNAPFHPTADGQQAIAKAVLGAIR